MKHDTFKYHFVILTEYCQFKERFGVFKLEVQTKNAHIFISFIR